MASRAAISARQNPPKRPALGRSKPGQSSQQAGHQAGRRGKSAPAPQVPFVVMERPRLMLSQEEAAEELGISQTFFTEERDAGRISVLSVGKRRLVPYAALVAYVRALCDEQGVPLDEATLVG